MAPYGVDPLTAKVTLKTIRWTSVRDAGLEHLNLTVTDVEILAVGTISGGVSSAPCDIRYDLRCDRNWQVRELRVHDSIDSALHLLADGHGRWQLANGVTVPELDGCIDVDISATPFTNTLPIRRLELAVGERRLIRVAFVEVPGLTVSALDQAYTCLEMMRRYRYESVSRRFTADIEVDEDGLVLSYPGRFQRQR